MRQRPTQKFVTHLFAAAGLTFTAACGSDSTLAPVDDAPQISGNAIAGLEAFELECASCHSARDAFDLAFFAFPDTTIVRRAVAHVDTSTAHDIVAYVRTVRALPTSRDFRPFQPGGSRAAGDANFASQLFGGDWFPEDMTAERMLAIDPLDVPIALEFPQWSVEFDNIDWMPDVPIAQSLLDYPTQWGTARAFLESYHQTHSENDLLFATLILRTAERDPDNIDAPCVREPMDRFRSEECFETRRWIATLAGHHMLRNGQREAVHPILHDGWWDVGNTARLSRFTDELIDNVFVNWAQWMYLGWAFEPDRHSSVYLNIAFEQLGLSRHGTFHAARALVARGDVGHVAFLDVRHLARFSPDHWTYDAVRFGLQEALDRLNRGQTIRRQDQIDEARAAIVDSYVLAARKVVDEQERAALSALQQQVVAGLDAMTPTDQ